MSDDNQVQVKFGGTTDELNSATQDAKAQISDFADSVKTIGEAVGVAFSVDKIEDFISSMSDLGDSIERIQAMTGQSSEQVQNFQFAIQMTGGDAETAGASLLRLERNIADAAGGSEKATEAFERAGVSAKDIASGDVNAILGDMADKFSSTADGANKVAVAMELAGRGGASLIPYLDQGRDGAEAMSAAFDSTNAKLGPLAAQFAQTARDIDLMKESSTGVGVQIEGVLNPAVQAAVTGLTLMSQEFSENVKEGGAWADLINILGIAIDGIVAALLTMKSGLTEMGDVAIGVLKSIVDEAIGVGEAIDDVFHGKLVDAAADFGTAQSKALADLKGGFNDADQAAQKLLADLEKMKAVAQGGGGGLAPKTGPSKGTGHVDAPPAPDTGQDDGEKDALQQKISLYQQQYQAKKDTDDLSVQSGKMSHQEEFADLKAALDQEQSATDAAYEHELYDMDQTDADYNKLLAEKAVADQKFLNDHTRLTLEAGKQDSKAWDSAFETIDKSFDTMLTGILQGTQTLGQAFNKLAENLIISMLEAELKVQLAHAETVAKNIAASMAGDSTVTAEHAAQTAAGKAIDDAASSSTIMADAAKAAAGAYSALAGIPIIGPVIAPIAATVAFGAVAAFDSFDKGTDYVPSDQLANIHKGEIIVPAAQSDDIRSGRSSLGGGGGNSVHFHISALDGKSVKAMLKQHGGAIAASVLSAARNGHSGIRTARI